MTSAACDRGAIVGGNFAENQTLSPAGNQEQFSPPQAFENYPKSFSPNKLPLECLGQHSGSLADFGGSSSTAPKDRAMASGYAHEFGYFRPPPDVQQASSCLASSTRAGPFTSLRNASENESRVSRPCTDQAVGISSSSQNTGNVPSSLLSFTTVKGVASSPMKLSSTRSVVWYRAWNVLMLAYFQKR